MKIENKILKWLYGDCYKDKFYDEERQELKELLRDASCTLNESEGKK